MILMKLVKGVVVSLAIGVFGSSKLANKERLRQYLNIVRAASSQDISKFLEIYSTLNRDVIERFRGDLCELVEELLDKAELGHISPTGSEFFELHNIYLQL